MNDLAPVQTSIYGALTGAPATYPVYDPVPQGVAKPYITIGEWDADQDEELAVETTDATVNIHTWSATNGKAQSHAMREFIQLRLHGQTISGTWLVTEDNYVLLEDPSSTAAARLFHGIARYRARI